MRKTTLFFLLLLTSTSLISLAVGQYGEESTSLGQFVDEFTDLNNVSVTSDVVRNATLDVMELNITSMSLFSNFSYYIPFSVLNNRIGSNLTEFPVLISLSDSSGTTNENLTGIFDVLGNSYLKMAITDDSFSTEYYIEVEQWDFLNRIGTLWISVNASSLEDIDLFLHYGIEAANNTAFVGLPGSVVVQNIWDDNFIAVYHMSDETTSSILDSTDSDLDGTKTGANQPEEINGLVGLAQEFDPNEGIALDTYPGAYTTVTMESWFQADDTDNARTIFALGEPDNQIDRVQHGLGGDLIYNYFRTDGVTVNPSIAFSDEVNYHYFTTTRIGTATKGYLDGVYEAGLDGVVGVGTIQDLRQNWAGSVSVGGNWFDGTIDELRFSDIVRSFDYINATQFTCLDDLVEFNSIEQAGGYNPEGYFTTTDYLDNVNGSTLALMTQSRIFPNTHITVQFSEDNATWGDAEGIPGDSHDLAGGLETIDLRPWNESSSAYVMVNLTSSDPTVTPYFNQSRLITTEGAGAFGPGVNVTSEWIYFNASEIGVTTGTLDSGGLVNVSTMDGTRMNVSEVVGVPGMDILFSFTGIPTDAGCVWLVINSLYDGNMNHDFDIDLWNHTGSLWETIGHIPDQTAFEWVNSTIYDLRIPNDYVNATGDVRGRLYHMSPGNINHDLSIEFLNIYAEIPSSVTPSVAGDVDVGFFIALAIILSLIAYLLARSR